MRVQERLGHGEGWGRSWETVHQLKGRKQDFVLFCSVFHKSNLLSMLSGAHTCDLPGELPGMGKCGSQVEDRWRAGTGRK